jgi:hypothetical protein
LGEAAEVNRSAGRASILEALADATEAMTPINIADETGIPRPNVRQLLRSMVRKNEVLKGHRAKYAHPNNPEFLPVKAARKPKPINNDHRITMR